MVLSENDLGLYNHKSASDHIRKTEFLKSEIPHTNEIIEKLKSFQIAIPSWALGTGGTRFGRFAGGGEPRNLEEKIEDVALLHQLNKSSEAISLHIPWDVPSCTTKIKDLAKQHSLRFDAVNSNTFQDQPNQKLSYKFGSLQHVNREVRKQAIDHNLEVIQHGIELESKSIAVWLSDGSCFPGQLNFRKAFEKTLESLREIYASLPEDWKMFIEYKAFEPNFYSMTVGDWGQSLLFASKLGSKAFSLVDLGHHLPNTNIEQIVSLLLMERKLGGFHFNDSKYSDDDLTTGSIKPYQLFLIFCELVEGMDAERQNHSKDMAWMIDASHNIKDPLEDLLQSIEAIKIAYAQALLVDRKKLTQAQEQNDVVQCQEILQNAFRTDVRPLVAEARLALGGSLDPIGLFRSLNIRKKLIQHRELKTFTAGL